MLKEQLKKGEKKIGIWGCGYIGYSSMAYFAKNGVACVGTDIIKERVDMINKDGSCLGYPNVEYWLGFDTKVLSESKLMYATTDWKELIQEDVVVHLVCIPTEKDGQPYDDILIDVIEKLAKEYKNKRYDEKTLIIIESTLTPNRVEKVVIPIFKKNGLSIGKDKDILLGVAPRRDWFVSSEKNLKTLPRVVGGTDNYTSDVMGDVLGIVSDTILKATDHKHASIVKSIENAYRQLDITFANQLSLAYPHLNMVEILKLVGTKWNIGTYHPSCGIGGYCIPLSPQYVIEGAEKPEKLTLLKASIETDVNQPNLIVNKLIREQYKNIGILGLSYTNELKVHTLSPTLRLVEGFKKACINVKVHDPLYSSDEIKEIIGVESFEFPKGLNEFDVVLIISPHMQYKFTDHNQINNNLKNCRLILDNMGTWNDITFSDNIQYHEVGDSHWLE